MSPCSQDRTGGGSSEGSTSSRAGASPGRGSPQRGTPRGRGSLLPNHLRALQRANHGDRRENLRAFNSAELAEDQWRVAVHARKTLPLFAKRSVANEAIEQIIPGGTSCTIARLRKHSDRWLAQKASSR